MMAARQIVAIVVMFLCCSLILTTEALYVPNGRQGAVAAEAVKRVAISGARQKRYTDYQERASAFCTGICMYESRKSYSDCFDTCNWRMTAPSDSEMENDYYSNSYGYDTQTPTTTTVTYEEPDYSNDQGAYTDTDLNQNKSRGKGKKGKSKSKNKEAREKKKLLKEMKRKLLQEIDLKQQELNEKAVLLEDTIGGLELDIEDSKHTITDLEERLDAVQQEMDKIEQLKLNISSLMKNRKQIGKATEVDTFLLPNIPTAPDELNQALKNLLVNEKDKRQWLQSIHHPVKRDFNLEHADQFLTNGIEDKMSDLMESQNNLGKISGDEIELMNNDSEGSG